MTAGLPKKGKLPRVLQARSRRAELNPQTRVQSWACTSFIRRQKRQGSDKSRGQRAFPLANKCPSSSQKTCPESGRDSDELRETLSCVCAEGLCSTYLSRRTQMDLVLSRPLFRDMLLCLWEVRAASDHLWLQVCFEDLHQCLPPRMQLLDSIGQRTTTTAVHCCPGNMRQQPSTAGKPPGHLSLARIRVEAERRTESEPLNPAPA